MQTLGSLTTKITISRDALEFFLTGMLAFVFTIVYIKSPILVAGITLVVVTGMFLCYQNRHYPIFFLASIMPFNDVYFISIFSFKRLAIWSIMGYILLQRPFARKEPAYPQLALLNKMALLFGAALLVSLIKTVIELDTGINMTQEFLAAAVFSDALVAVEQFCVFYLVLYLLDDAKQIQQLVTLMLGVSLSIALLGVYQYFNGEFEPLHFLYSIRSQPFQRASAIYTSPNEFGHYVAPHIVMATILFLWGNISQTFRFAFILPVILIETVGLMTSFSRGGIVALFLGLLTMTGLYVVSIRHKKHSWKILLVLGITIGAAFIAVHYYDTFVRLRLARPSSEKYYQALHWMKTISDAGRKQASLTAVKTFFAHPFLGVGYNVFMGKRLATGFAVDNQYLKILAEMGLFGFVPFATILYIILRLGLRGWRESQALAVNNYVEIMKLLVLSGFFTTTYTFLFADTLSSRSISGNFWMLAAAIVLLERFARETPAPQ